MASLQFDTHRSYIKSIMRSVRTIHRGLPEVSPRLHNTGTKTERGRIWKICVMFTRGRHKISNCNTDNEDSKFTLLARPWFRTFRSPLATQLYYIGCILQNHSSECVCLMENADTDKEPSRRFLLWIISNLTMQVLMLLAELNCYFHHDIERFNAFPN